MASPERPVAFRLLAISAGEASRGARQRSQLLGWLERMAEHAPQVAIQLREKGLDDRAAWELVCRAREIFPGILVVNARPDLALSAGADGVHLPSAAIVTDAVVKRYRHDLIVGRSTHSAAEVEREASRADYVCLGPAFPTPSKPGARPLPHRAYSRRSEPGPRVFALGGVDSASAAQHVLAAGAHGVAGIRLFQDPSRIPALLSELASALADDDQGLP